MVSKRVTVFGGSGFLGRQIVKSLAAEGTNVRVAVRHPERASFIERLGRNGQIELVRANVWEESTVARAMKQAASVINTVGHYVEKSGATFDAIHGQGARNVARQAGEAGVARLIHISGLGADPRSDSPYRLGATFPLHPRRDLQHFLPPASPPQTTDVEGTSNHIVQRLAKRERRGLSLDPSWPSCETVRLM